MVKGRKARAKLRVMSALMSAEEVIRNVVKMDDLKVTPHGVRLDINMHLIIEDGYSLHEYADALASIINIEVNPDE
jgi:hypothetical protein